jgi:hypothetical protein
MYAYVRIIRELVGLLNFNTFLIMEGLFIGSQDEKCSNNRRMHALKLFVVRLFRSIVGGVIYQSWKKDMR